MSPTDKLYYLKNKEINKQLWDNCIRNAENRLIYGLSFYLDELCNWDGIVLNDYGAVMPLPWRKKWGIRYVYQPAFMQRLGVFGYHFADEIISKIFFEASKKFFFLHYNISQPVKCIRSSLIKHQNFIIHLDRTYNDIRECYTQECIRNIQKAESRGCVFSNNISAEEIVKMFRSAYGELHPQLKTEDYDKLIALLKKAQGQNAVELCSVENFSGASIYGAAIFKDSARISYAIGAPTEEGRQKRATYFFIDHLLQKNATTGLLFDFEGSEIPSVADFYQKFGPTAEYYYELKMSRIPFLINYVGK
ncbi:MAG: hypothetical protein ICV66_05210 [Chitinophagaceae bacterium]|nr:hypothetical protein [Chitinophagaceae bacterium]